MAKYINELGDLVAEINERKIAVNFLQKILTPAELEEIAKRLQIFKMLKKGIPQRQISKKLDVSIATVSRGSRELKYGGKFWWDKHLKE